MILVTGASGFVGRTLVRRLTTDRAPVVLAVRRPGVFPTLDERLVAGLGPETDWKDALRGVTKVVHLSARVHVMSETERDALSAYRLANVQGTAALATQAARAGVEKFVFVSTIKVLGEMTEPGRPFRPSDTPAPTDPYGVSKWEAEQVLWQVATATGMQVTIVRPPLVYGPGVGANFRSLMNLVRRGVPLPFGAIDNKRSLIAVDNLADLVVECLANPAAAGQTFLASDDYDLSTPECVELMARALGRPARLFPVPPRLLDVAARAVGRPHITQRLCSSLQADISGTRRQLCWQPPVSVEEGFSRAMRG